LPTSHIAVHGKEIRSYCDVNETSLFHAPSRDVHRRYLAQCNALTKQNCSAVVFEKDASFHGTKDRYTLLPLCSCVRLPTTCRLLPLPKNYRPPAEPLTKRSMQHKSVGTHTRDIWRRPNGAAWVLRVIGNARAPETTFGQ
jgi:hypothetical protein